MIRKVAISPVRRYYSNWRFFSNKSSVDNKVEILKSRTLVQKVVNNLQLNTSYFVDGRVKEVLTYGNLPFSLQWLSLNDTINKTSYVISPIGNDKFELSGKKGTRTAAWNDTLHLQEGVAKISRTGFLYPVVLHHQSSICR